MILEELFYHRFGCLSRTKFSLGKKPKQVSGSRSNFHIVPLFWVIVLSEWRVKIRHLIKFIVALSTITLSSFYLIPSLSIIEDESPQNSWWIPDETPMNPRWILDESSMSPRWIPMNSCTHFPLIGPRALISTSWMIPMRQPSSRNIGLNEKPRYGQLCLRPDISG